jgi:hypothetical protein
VGSSFEQVRSPVAERVHQCDQLAVDYSALIQITREVYERALDDCDSFVFTGYSPALGRAVRRRILRKE